MYMSPFRSPQPQLRPWRMHIKAFLLRLAWRWATYFICIMKKFRFINAAKRR